MGNGTKLIVTNKHAYRNYEILDEFEAGLVLHGTEVKSISKAECSVNEAYVTIDNNLEAWLINMHVKPYEQGNIQNKDPYRSRKLLLHHNEIIKLAFMIKKDRLTIVPIKIYWKYGKIKVLIGLGRGKKLHDKREDLKKRTIEREMRG